MTYTDQYQMAQDPDLRARIAACAATQTIPTSTPWLGRDNGPEGWARRHALAITGQPGWPAAWATALANNIETPGRDLGVISDGMILSAVQAVLAVG